MKIKLPDMTTRQLPETQWVHTEASRTRARLGDLQLGVPFLVNIGGASVRAFRIGEEEPDSPMRLGGPPSGLILGVTPLGAGGAS